MYVYSHHIEDFREFFALASIQFIFVLSQCPSMFNLRISIYRYI